RDPPTRLGARHRAEEESNRWHRGDGTGATRTMHSSVAPKSAGVKRAWSSCVTRCQSAGFSHGKILVVEPLPRRELMTGAVPVLGASAVLLNSQGVLTGGAAARAAAGSGAEREGDGGGDDTRL